MVRSVARNLTMEASQKQPICKPGRRKRRSKNEQVLMVYRVPYSPLFIALYYVPGIRWVTIPFLFERKKKNSFGSQMKVHR